MRLSQTMVVPVSVFLITGSWNEDFVIDMTTKTAVSMLDGMVYDIVPGKMLDSQYVE